MATVAITAILELIENPTLAMKGTDCIIVRCKLNTSTIRPQQPLQPSWTKLKTQH
jgi:hypothetical protein